MSEVIRRRADWSNLRVFFAVAEAGGFNAAARALNVNPSTVTRTVEELERQLNTTLFNRGPRGVTLTEAGVRAYQRVRTMEKTVEALEFEIADSEDAVEGRIKLAAPDGLAGFFISPDVPAFLRAYPKIDLVIDSGLWPDRPLDGEADLTLTFSEPSHPDAIAKPIAYVHYGLFASREYLDLYGEPKTSTEVLQHPYIHHVAQNHQKENWGERAQAVQTLMNKRVQTNSSAVVVQAVKNGVGIAALPTGIMTIEPDLVMLKVGPIAPTRLWLVHHRDIGRSARVRAAIEWLKDVFDPRTRPWYRREFVHPKDFGEIAIPLPAANRERSAPRQRRR